VRGEGGARSNGGSRIGGGRSFPTLFLIFLFFFLPFFSLQSVMLFPYLFLFFLYFFILSAFSFFFFSLFRSEGQAGRAVGRGPRTPDEHSAPTAAWGRGRREAAAGG